MVSFSNGLYFQYATLLVMFINNAAFQTVPTTDLFRTATLGTTYSFSPTKIPSSTTGKSDNNNSMYTRLIPALATIGLFLIGLFAIYVFYCVKQKESHKKESKPIEDEKTNNDWLAELRKTQKKSSFLFARRGSTFQAKLKLKKYALYDDMLARYKRSLKMQKLHSMRKTTTTTSFSQSTDSNDEAPLMRKTNSKQRMKEMAMRHKEQQSHLDFHLDLPSKERHLPRWGTTSSSVSQDENDSRYRYDSELESYHNLRDEMNKSLDVSPNVSFQISTDDDTEPLISSPRRRHENVYLTSKVPSKAPPTSKNESIQSSVDSSEKEDKVFDEESAAETTIEIVVSNKNQEDQSRNILDQPDIKDALRKLSSVEEAPARKTAIRPKSMTAVLSGGLVSSGIFRDDKHSEKASQKRQSWYQGLFKKKQPETNHTASVDDLIDDHMNKAIYSRLIDSDYVVDEDGPSGEIRQRNPNVRQRPKSWMPPSENQRKKLLAKKIDPITELFANLMDLPPAKREGSWYDNMPSSSETTSDHPVQSQPSATPSEPYGEAPRSSMSEKEELMLINEMEKRMIENIDDNEILDSEVTALESLLNDVARFCHEYSEDYGDVEHRRQISFSEANETLKRSKKPRSNTPKKQDSFDVRAAKAMSVYDTQLLQPSKEDEPTTTL